MSAYADTSFLVSLYVPDTNSAEALGRMRKLPLPLLITPLGELEFINALELRAFRDELRPTQARAVRAVFQTDLQGGVFARNAVTEDIFLRARELSLRWTSRIGARSLDIIHIASAIALRADLFHTFDARQRKLAAAAGLAVT